MAKCKSGYIINPTTGRCVKKSGKIGMSLRAVGRAKRKSKRKSHKRKSHKRKSPITKCGKNKVLNPSTGRCVKKNGKIGLLLRKSTKRKSTKRKSKRKSPSDSQRQLYAERLFEEQTLHLKGNINAIVQKRWGRHLFERIAMALNEPIDSIVFIKALKQGGFGCPYVVNIKDKNMMILKIEDYPKQNKTISDMKFEYYMHEMFYKNKTGAPRPFFSADFVNARNKPSFVMGMKLDTYATTFGTFDKLLETKEEDYILNYICDSIKTIMERMCSANLVHGDLHWGNIGFQNVSKQSQTALAKYNILKPKTDTYFLVSPLVIDFGWSSPGPCNPMLELVQLLRTSYPRYGPMNRYNQLYLYNHCIRPLWQKYSGQYLPDVLPSLNSVERLYDELVETHIENHKQQVRQYSFAGLI
jgi:hypothetical protein